ncbi:hypothetical protein CISG_06167 [Coccidioides immitis RMSCC 3703]|uniref:Uncharacterized protein n=1 Tax=Coccidioides immitis RMSCC 3703 TaxID=454286 RepID=A0A0J8QW94_COCIT|nr:hypothetical protein CISG_06167 [Coccidioides immitis RMSCC 3703]
MAEACLDSMIPCDGVEANLIGECPAHEDFRIPETSMRSMDERGYCWVKREEKRENHAIVTGHKFGTCPLPHLYASFKDGDSYVSCVRGEKALLELTNDGMRRRSSSPTGQRTTRAPDIVPRSRFWRE